MIKVNIKRTLAGILSLTILVQLVFCIDIFAAAMDIYEYEPGNFILDQSNALSWKNPTSDKLETVSAYMISESGEETNVTEKLTAVTPKGVAASVHTPSAIVTLPDASNSEEKACKCRMIFSFFDGTVRNIIIGETYGTTAVFIQQSHSLTENPLDPGKYLNVDVYNSSAAAKASLSNTVVKSGERSLKVESNNTAGKYFAVQFGGLVAGAAYSVSMQINTLSEAEYNLDGVKRTLPNTNGAWKKITFDYVKDSSSSFKIKPIGASREVYFDDITFTKKGDASPSLVMGFETRSVSAPSAINPINAAVGDGKVKLKWETQQNNTTGYINVYEKDAEKGLLLRARLKRPGSSEIILSNLKNDVKYTFVMKVQGVNNAWGYGLETDGVTVEATPHLYKDKQNIVLTAEAQAADLERLVEKCYARKIYPSYEISDANLLNVFAKKLRRLYENFEYEDYDIYTPKMTGIYNDVRSKLADIIDGKTDYREVPEYEAAGNEIKDGSLVVKSENGAERQFVGIGFNAFYGDLEDLKDMSSLGIRAIQFNGNDTGPVSFVKYDETVKDYVLNTERAEKAIAEFREEMDFCREKGIMVDVGTPVHYSDDVSSMSGASDYRSSGGSYGTFINFNPTSDTAKKMIKKYYELFIPLIYEYKDIVTSITFVNEPYFEAWDKSYYYDKWTDYLKAKYKNIQALNEVYSASYNSFESVKMPEYIPGRDENSSGVWTTPLHMDYRLFVTDIMYEFFDYCITEIDKYTNGEIPCGVKTMEFFREYTSRWNTCYSRAISYDYEKMTELFGFNGMDSFSYYKDSANGREGSTTLPAKLSWYDFTTSLKNVPVLDTETHVAVDDADSSKEGCQMEDTEILPDYMAASAWMGAMHGCDLAAVWTYADPWQMTSMQNTVFTRRPDALRAMSHAALDARRLSEEINAIQMKKRDVALLYSYEGFMYNLQYQSNLFTAYNILMQKGQRPLYVTDKTIDKLADCKLLVIAGNLITNEKTVDAISDYVSGGGKVIFIGENCFSRDADNKQIKNSALLRKIAALKAKSTVIQANLLQDTSRSDFSLNAESIIEEMLNNLGLMDVRLVDKATGETAAVEWNAAEYNGDILISACNYSDDSIKVTVEKNGLVRSGADDIKNNEFNLSEITLKPYIPVLLRISDIGYDVSLLKNTGAKIYKVSKGGSYSAKVILNNYESEEPASARLIAAVYCGDRLCGAYMSKDITAKKGENKTGYVNNIAIPNDKDEEYILKLMLWDGTGECMPLKEAKIIRE